MISCAMFDFGHVLMPLDPRRFCNFARSRQALGAIEPERFFGFTCVSRFDKGEISAEEFCLEMKKNLQINVSDDEFWFQYCDVMLPDLKMVALKDMLKENGFKLAMISNINERHYEYARNKYPEVFTNFDYLALSFKRELSVIKPNLKMYQVPADALKVKPEECLLVDDVHINIKAFEQWGGVGHHYNVADDRLCPNGCLEKERNRLLLRMVNLEMLTLNQAGSIARTDFSQLE